MQLEIFAVVKQLLMFEKYYVILVWIVKISENFN